MSLTSEFSNAVGNVSLVHVKAQDQELQVLNLEKSVGADAIGQQERVNNTDQGGTKDNEKKKRERYTSDLVRQQLIDNAVRQAQELNEAMQIKLHEIRARIYETEISLSELDADLQSIKDALDKFDNSKGFEFDVEGKLKDIRLQRLLDEWQKDRGSKAFDYNNSALIYSIIKKASEDKLKEKAEKVVTLEEDKKKEQKLIEAQEIVDEIEKKLKSDDPNEVQEALEKLEKLNNQFIKEFGSSTLDNSIKEKNAKHDGFAFNAPPIKDDFSKSASGEISDKVVKVEQENKPAPASNFVMG